MSSLEEITNFLEYLGDAIIIVDTTSKIVFSNTACNKLFSYPSGALTQMSLEDLMGTSKKKNHRDMVRTFIQQHSSARVMMTRATMPCTDASGNLFSARISIASVNIDNQSYGIATIQDFTTIQKEIKQLESSTYQDVLTGLYNKRYLQKVTMANSRILNSWVNIGIIFIDLDKFKPVNDQFGHEAGDAILKVVSNRIKGVLRFNDIVFRLGGDEFLIFLNLTDVKQRKKSVQNIAEKIHSEVTQPIDIEKNILTVDLSAGCALYPEDGGNLNKLINLADKAMYSAKSTESDVAWVNPSADQ